jgi:hypothetical protein
MAAELSGLQIALFLVCVSVLVVRAWEPKL